MVSRSRLSAALPTLLLLCVTAVWGWTFLVVKTAVGAYPVPSFLVLRFLLAAALLAPFGFRRGAAKALMVGALIGIPLASGYFFQTAGLETTSAADAGLLTGLFVIFTPIADRLMYSTPIARATLISALAGLCGTALLTVEGRHGLSIGDLFEVVTAVAFAIHTVFLGRRSGGYRPETLAMGQMSVGALLFLLIVPLGGSPLRWPTASVWFAVVITGAVASALAFWVQTFVQQRVAPSRTAIILLAEPAFATAFAVWLGGVRLNVVQWVGASLIFLSLISHEAWIAFHGPTKGEIL